MSKDAAAKVRFIGFRSLNQLGTTREASDASSTYIALIFAVSATVGLLLAIDPPWAAVLAAGSPLIAAANYAKRYRDLLDYRIIYLLALLFWSYQPTFGLIGLLIADRSAVDSFNPVIFVHYSSGPHLVASFGSILSAPVGLLSSDKDQRFENFPGQSLFVERIRALCTYIADLCCG